MLLNHSKWINDIAAKHNNQKIEKRRKNSIYNLFSIKTLDCLASKYKKYNKKNQKYNQNQP